MRWFTRFRLGTKLMIAFIGVGLLSSGVGFLELPPFVSPIVCIAIGGVFGYFMWRDLTTPLKLVTIGASKHSVGDLERGLADSEKDRVRLRGDELGDLGKSFDRTLEYLKEMADAANKVADGDLTADIHPKCDVDELGHGFARMLANLRDLVGQVAEHARQLALSAEELSDHTRQAGDATEQVSVTIQQVARGAGDQTKAITDAATVVEQMAGIIQSVAASAESVAAASTLANTSAQAGSESVNRAIEAIARINGAIEPAAEKVKELGVSSTEIGKIVEVIDDIAEQTNLLALNAAIEAARAGEHGKGFAVVADEVRKLAERSSKATKEIANLVTMVQQGTEQAVSAMSQGVKEVETGSRLAAEAGSSLDDILRAVSATNERVHSISASALEMTGCSQLVVKSIENISSISEENAAAAEEVSASTEETTAQVSEIGASAQELARMADELRALVARFTLQSRPASDVTPRRRAGDWNAPTAARASVGHARKAG